MPRPGAAHGDHSERPLGRTEGRVDALVTDGEARAAVAGVRALGKAGLRTLVMGRRPTAPGLWSRHTTSRALGPPSHAPEFIERIAELAARHGPLVIHPAQEETLDPLIEADGRLPSEAILPYAGPGPLRLLRDKSRLAGLAEEAGLAAPATLAFGAAGVIAEAPPTAPCVVKSTGRSRTLEATRLIDSDDELAVLLASLPPDERIIVQERSDGPLVGLALVLDREGRVVAQFQQVAARLWPVGAGGSSAAVSVAPDRDLIERTAHLLRQAGHWGLAQLQFLTTSRGPALIDVNARYYGSMPLATAAGVNLAVTWQAVALGERLPEPAPYKVGVTYRWLEADIGGALKTRSRAQLRSLSGRSGSGAMWASDDPLPAALMTMRVAAAPFRRRVGRFYRQRVAAARRG
jgi:predicted ATP-grasp superfamily ATP-dependent carboligase